MKNTYAMTPYGRRFRDRVVPFYNGNQNVKLLSTLIIRLVNDVDARLMNASLAHGIDPESPEAPLPLLLVAGHQQIRM